MLVENATRRVVEIDSVLYASTVNKYCANMLLEDSHFTVQPL